MITVTINNILICKHNELLEFCDQYYEQDPTLGASHQVASRVIGNLARSSNYYSFLMRLLIRVRVAVRDAKALKIDVRDLMTKRDILESVIDVLKKKYEAGSRIWTLHHDDLQLTPGAMRRGFPG